MKKIISVLTFVFIFGLISLCSASLSLADCALGGIGIGADAAYVKSVYGEPTKVTTSRATDWTMYNYGGSFVVSFDENKVVNVSTSANNGIATPAGITVGMKRADVLTVYGTPTNTGYGKNHRVVSLFFDAGNNYTGLAFVIHPETDKVTEIRAGYFF